VPKHKYPADTEGSGMSGSEDRYIGVTFITNGHKILWLLAMVLPTAMAHGAVGPSMLTAAFTIISS
jgi:hypothetical protein